MPAGEREDRVDAAGAQSAGNQVSGAYLASMERRCSWPQHNHVMVDTDVLIAGGGPIPRACRPRRRTRRRQLRRGRLGELCSHLGRREHTTLLYASDGYLWLTSRHTNGSLRKGSPPRHFGWMCSVAATGRTHGHRAAGDRRQRRRYRHGLRACRSVGVRRASRRLPGFLPPQAWIQTTRGSPRRDFRPARGRCHRMNTGTFRSSIDWSHELVNSTVWVWRRSRSPRRAC